MSSEMIKFLEKRGILRKLPDPENPHQNGVAERFNRILIELFISMLHQKKLPKSCWSEALNIAVHILNRVIKKSL